MTSPIWGIMAEFDTPSMLVAAARRARQKGYHKIHAYSPFPVEELDEALELPPNRLPMIVLAAGILGAFTGYFLQLYIAAVHYPLNIGGRPLDSWPAFIPITFELTVLFSAVA